MTSIQRIRLHPVAVVAGRELKARLTTFTFLASSVFILLLAAGAALFPLVSLVGTTPVLVLSTPDAVQHARSFANDLAASSDASGADLHPTVGVSKDPVWDAETLVLEGRHPIVVVLDPSGEVSRVVFLSTPNPLVVASVQAATADAPPVDVVLAAPAATNASGAAAGLVATTLLLTAVTFNSTIVLFGVVEEKSTRVMELVLSRARPVHVLVGKVVGICASSALQFGGFAGVYLVLAAVLGTSLIPAGVFSGWLVVWLVVGYAVSSLLAATLGSLISRPEDAPQVTTPLTLIIATTFILAMPAAVSPNGVYARLLSFFPPTAAPTMMVRSPAGVGMVEQLTALVVAVGFILVLGQWSAGVYRCTALAFGSRVRFREAFRSRR